MKAVVCKQFGPPDSLRVEELPSPRAGPGEAVVTVKAASLNFPDVLIIQNKYQIKPPLPFSPGSEMAGLVKEVGEGAEGGERDHLVARLEGADAGADLLDHPGQLAAGGKGQRRLELVLVLDDEHVREIQARRLDADDDFAGACLGRRQVLDHQ